MKIIIYNISFLVIVIAAFPSSITVKEDVGDVEVCFMVIQGSIATNSACGNDVKGRTEAVDGTARGTFVIS